MSRRNVPAGRSSLLPAVLLLYLLLPSAARAQWAAELAAGRATYDPVSARINAVNGSLGLRYADGPGRWLYLAGGAALGSPGPSWGAAGVGGRRGFALKGIPVGVEAGAHFFGYSESEYGSGPEGVTVRDPAGGGVTLELTPTLELRRGIAELELRAGVVESIIFASGLSNALTALDGGAVLSSDAFPWLRVSGIGRFLYLPEGGYPYLGASAQLTRGPATAWAFGGGWTTELIEAPRGRYGVGGSLALGAGAEVSGSWQQEPSDPIYASTARRTWSLRLSRSFGRRPAPAVAPRSAPVADGLVVIRLPLAAATEAPSVVGDFTGWQPVLMSRVGGSWEVRLPIPPGAHRYGFRTASGAWFLPEGLPRADDGMGGESAILLVP